MRKTFGDWAVLLNKVPAFSDVNEMDLWWLKYLFSSWSYLKVMWRLSFLTFDVMIRKGKVLENASSSFSSGTYLSFKMWMRLSSNHSLFSSKYILIEVWASFFFVVHLVQKERWDLDALYLMIFLKIRGVDHFSPTAYYSWTDLSSSYYLFIYTSSCSSASFTNFLLASLNC